MRNPVLQEAAQVYVERREYKLLHLAFMTAIALVTVAFWPAKGFMIFFRTGTVPAVLQASLVVQLLAVTGLSLIIGLDRLAGKAIILHSEWLERTAIPVGVLFRGKLTVAVLHTLVLTGLGVPFAVVSAGPAGVPLDAVFASLVVVLLSGLCGRFAGMLVSHLGEQNYVVRITGGWIFLALLFVATLPVHLPLNPIAAVVMLLGTPGDTQLLLAWTGPAALSLILVVAYRFTLVNRRARAVQEGHDAR